MTLANLNLKSILTDSTKQKQVIVIGVGLVISYYGFGIVKGAVKVNKNIIIEFVSHYL